MAVNNKLVGGTKGAKLNHSHDNNSTHRYQMPIHKQKLRNESIGMNEVLDEKAEYTIAGGDFTPQNQSIAKIVEFKNEQVRARIMS